MKVLIVDDHASMRELIRSVVSDLVESCIECRDGSEVVETYAAQRLGDDDYVLMDLRMPGVPGLEATRRLCAAFPAARVIVVTQFGDADLRAAALEAGACGFVLKEDLLELRRLLAGAGSQP